MARIVEGTYSVTVDGVDQREVTPPGIRLEIDENILDQEWQGHAEQAFQWSMYAAECRRVVEENKSTVELAIAQLKRVAAEQDDGIRREPLKYGMSVKGGDGYVKMTEPCIANTVLLQPLYQKAEADVHIARQKLTQAKYTLDVAEGAVSALKDRKHGIQDIVSLHLSGYFGSPREQTARADNMTDDEKRALRRGTRDRRRQHEST